MFSILKKISDRSFGGSSAGKVFYLNWLVRECFLKPCHWLSWSHCSLDVSKRSEFYISINFHCSSIRCLYRHDFSHQVFTWLCLRCRHAYVWKLLSFALVLNMGRNSHKVLLVFIFHHMQTISVQTILCFFYQCSNHQEK